MRFIDQTKLPTEETYVTCKTYEEVADAIRTMIVRGAPAIGVTAAMGVALGVRDSQRRIIDDLTVRVWPHICDVLASTRPTAVNLFWAIRRMQKKFDRVSDAADPADQAGDDRRSPAHDGGRHCHERGDGTAWRRTVAGQRRRSDPLQCRSAWPLPAMALALGVIRAAIDSGKKLRVFADETRPFLQGSRLTAWELMKDNIPTTVISDNMAGAMMRQGKIDAVIVGADRIAANGDVANKIGTYSVAVLAKEHGIPFYVAAPFSTSIWIADGAHIPIEQRLRAKSPISAASRSRRTA